ncbi:MAG TPA: MBL fold metallo-hydrolase, partial [Desulfobacter postgatei]|nr:MBL fold metallo-hydrolase [Desulfobacter postgatei]
MSDFLVYMRCFVPCRSCILLQLLMLVFLLGCSPEEKQTFSEDVWEKEVSRTQEKDFYAPHKKDDRYFAPWMKMPDKSFLDVLGWKFFSKTNYTKEEREFLPKILPQTLQRVQKTRGDFILWIGHNTFLVRTGEQYWLTDPIFSKRALIPGRKTPPALTLEEINTLVKVPNILISHNHYDHLDRGSIKGLPNASRVFVPKGLAVMVKKMNKPHTLEMDWWEEKTLS